MWDLPGPGLKPVCVPCIGRRILNHCATREIPRNILYLTLISYTQTFTAFIRNLFLVQILTDCHFENEQKTGWKQGIQNAHTKKTHAKHMHRTHRNALCLEHARHLNHTCPDAIWLQLFSMAPRSSVLLYLCRVQGVHVNPGPCGV